MKRIFTIVLSVVIACTFTFGECFAAADEPDINATTAILIDAHSGEVLWEKNADVQMAPASMTKMMTAILTVENLDMDTVVTVDEEMVNAGGSMIYMEVGEEFTVEQLLKAMMVGSENDCAVALAKTISGTVKDFANLMNGRAKELGCKDTNFENPNGLDDSKHKSTAYDMSRIAMEVMKHDDLRKIVKMKSYKLPETNKCAARKIESTNRMLWDKQSMIEVNGENRSPYYSNCIGIKTGYTDVAQACLASCVSKDGTELISVVMHTGDLERFAESIEVLEWGLKHYTGMTIYSKGDSTGTVKVRGGKPGKAQTEAAYYAGGVTADGESADSVTAEVVFDKKLTAPMKAGEKVGTVNVCKDGKKLTEIDVLLSEDVEEGLFSFIYTGHVAHKGQLIAFIAGMLILLIAILILVLRFINKRKARKRRESLARKRARQEKYKDM